MLDFVKKYATSGKYSQNGEQGIIDEVLARIKRPLVKEAVEYGGADGFYCSNTAHLREMGWHVRMYDLEAMAPHVEKMVIAPGNVNDVVGFCTVVSMDTDGLDYAIWNAYKFTPEIVIVEINSSLHPLKDHVSIEEGANYSAMVKLGLSKGYFLLCHTGNLVFVHGANLGLFPEVVGTNPIKDWKQYFNQSWLK